MKRLLATTILTFGVFGGALADDLALVIGNGTYANAPEADTAVRDAEAVTQALTDAGWTVTKGVNLDRDAMQTMIRDFAAGLDKADRIAIFYSGHALRSGGMTYLAPIDARADTLTDVLFEGVPLDLLLRLAATRPGDAVVFVDGAQLRGFRPTDFVEPGLADLEGPEGVMIISAAAPGRAVRRSRWRDSRFARLIVDRFMQPGASVREVAGSVPNPTFVTGDVDDDFVMVDPPAPADDPSSLDAEIELTFWRAAERSGRKEDYEAYLKRYPDGYFVELARQRLGIREDGTREPEVPEVDPVVEAENALNLSRIRKRRVQEYLQALGFDPRGIDGIFGPGTRNALRGWQRSRRYDNTGYLNAEQLQQLRAEGMAAIEEARRLAEEARQKAEAEDNAFWEDTGALGTAGGLRAYLEKYPEGIHAAPRGTPRLPTRPAERYGRSLSRLSWRISRGHLPRRGPGPAGRDRERRTRPGRARPVPRHRGRAAAKPGRPRVDRTAPALPGIRRRPAGRPLRPANALGDPGLPGEPRP